MRIGRVVSSAPRRPDTPSPGYRPQCLCSAALLGGYSDVTFPYQGFEPLEHNLPRAVSSNIRPHKHHDVFFQVHGYELSFFGQMTFLALPCLHSKIFFKTSIITVHNTLAYTAQQKLSSVCQATTVLSTSAAHSTTKNLEH
eukprot:489669-Pelagomonas_calceolata.AAC.1